jgi:hypothetical protein
MSLGKTQMFELNLNKYCFDKDWLNSIAYRPHNETETTNKELKSTRRENNSNTHPWGNEGAVACDAGRAIQDSRHGCRELLVDSV